MTTNSEEWCNWSGSVRFTPACIARPRSEDELATIVREAAASRRAVRVVGAGHSSMPLVETREVLVSLKKMQGVIGHDRERCQATILPGMTVEDAGAALHGLGLAMHNTGDVDMQLLSGAIGTGTHGSGYRLQNLSAMLAGVRLVTATGEVREFSVERDPDFLNAAPVALGSLGIYSALTLQLQPSYRLLRREWCTTIEPALEQLDSLVQENRNFDMYWYPRSDEAKLRLANLHGSGTQEVPGAKCVKEEEGWVHEVLPKTRTLKFDEMEYALPAEAGVACFREIRERIKARHRQYVGWRVFFRTVAPDETLLSPCYGRQTVTIAILQNIGLEYWAYFKDIQPIFLAHGGRPHWGKKHTLTASQLRPLYPEWDRFQKLRLELDPEGLFMNAHLKQLFEQ